MHPLKKLFVFAPYFHHTLVAIKTVLPVKLKFAMKLINFYRKSKFEVNR